MLLAGCGSDDDSAETDTAATEDESTPADGAPEDETASEDTASEEESTEENATDGETDDGAASQGNESGSADAPAGDTLSWFPAEAGATWTYTQDAGGQTIEQTQTLSSVEPGDDGTTITISNEFDNGLPPQDLSYTVEDDGSVSVPFQSFNPGGAAGTVEASGDLVWLSPDQFAAGETAEGELTVDIDAGGQNVTADVSYTATPVGVEAVSVPAGDYDASHMRLDITIDTQGISQDLGLDIWFVEGIGYVKQSVELLGQAVDVEMTAFTPAS